MLVSKLFEECYRTAGHHVHSLLWVKNNLYLLVVKLELHISKQEKLKSDFFEVSQALF